MGEVHGELGEGEARHKDETVTGNGAKFKQPTLKQVWLLLLLPSLLLY